VQEALRLTANIGEKEGDRRYVDGGALDNKPFGPVLNSIYYRMPTGIVDRRLFYVEPDPQKYPKESYEGSKEPLDPLHAIISTASGIPLHESIKDDLDNLKAHNSKVKWLKSLIEETLKDINSITQTPDPRLQNIYNKTQIESITKSVVLHTDNPPSSKDQIEKPSEIMLFECIRKNIEKITDSDPKKLTPYDISYHLRKSYFVLYKIYEKLDENPNDDKLIDALNAVGRIIKTYKIIRYSMLRLRNKLVPSCLDDPKKESNSLIKCFKNYLIVDQGHQTWLNLDFSSYDKWSTDDIKDRENGKLSTSRLSDLNNKARNKVKEVDLEEEEIKGQDSVLSFMDKVLGNVVSDCGLDLNPYLIFDDVDLIIFPQEYLSGIFEKDIIEFVRISPKDAQCGLSKMEAGQKVAGESLGHFSAFFRRDWRSNDILWGRLDSICLIIESLLSDKELERLIRMPQKRAIFDKLFDGTNKSRLSLKQEYSLQDCPDQYLDHLEKAWSFMSNHNNKDINKYKHFREALIEAGQHNIAHQDLPKVYEDMYYQEIVWDQIKGNKNFKNEMKKYAKQEDNNSIKSSASSKVIQREARRLAKSSLGQLEKSYGDHFKEIQIGSENVIGKNSSVPPHILGEYVTQAWLVFLGMLKLSFGKTGEEILNRKSVKFIFQHPVMFFHILLQMNRRDKILGMIFSTVIASICITIIILSLVFVQIELWPLSQLTTWLWIIIPILILYLLYKFIVIRYMRK